MKARAQILRKRFAKFELEEMSELDDLSVNLWAALTETLTPREMSDIPADFSGMEREIAQEIFNVVATNDDLTFAQGELLLSVSRALVDKDSAWSMKLSYYRRGKPVSKLAKVQQLEKTRQIALWLDKAVEGGEKIEPAIAAACAKFKIKRSTAFKIWGRKDELGELNAKADEVRGVYDELGFDSSK